VFGYEGEHGVLGYRARRKAHNSDTARGSDCFHVNGKASPVVEAEHWEVSGQSKCDKTTKRVLQILSDMLEIDPRSRPSANQVRDQFVEIREDAKGKKAMRASTTSRKVSSSTTASIDAYNPLRASQNPLLRNSEMRHRQTLDAYNSSEIYGEVKTMSPRSMTGYHEASTNLKQPSFLLSPIDSIKELPSDHLQHQSPFTSIETFDMLSDVHHERHEIRTDLVQDQAASMSESSTSVAPPNHLSFHDALKWRVEKRTQPSLAELPNSFLLEDLKQRKHVSKSSTAPSDVDIH